MKFKYYNPVKIHFGVDFAEVLQHIAQRENNILLVTTKRWRKQEGKIEQILGKKLAQIIDEITPNPDIRDLQNLAQNMSDFDCIVAFGGGSVIDSAKFFSFSNSSSGNHCADLLDFESSQTPKSSSLPKSSKNSISTTANTRIFLDSNQGNSSDSNANDSSDSNNSNDSPSLAVDTPPQTPPARRGAFSLSPSLAEGARGWVDSTKNTESANESRNSTNPPKQTIEGIAVEVLDLEKNLGAKLDLESVSLPNFSPSAKDAPKRELPKAKPIYAFPTTSGTSSELTHWATVWDNTAFIKHSLSDEILYPKEAFYNPRLTLSVPRETTIHTALDALSHAFESIWNNNANPISTHHALCAIEIILRDLPALAENLHSLELRTNLMQASMHAGLAFSNTQTALAHALSYPLTMRFDTPHGLACSFSLPLLLDCLPKQSHAYALLSPFRARLFEVFEALSISPNPKDYGLDSAFIDEIFATLNARAKNGIFDIERVQKTLLENL